MRSIYWWIFLLSISAFLGFQSNAELFSSVNEFQQLVTFETLYIKEMEQFIDNMKTNLKFLKKRLKIHQKENDEAQKDPILYVSNPLNAFLITQRLTSGVNQMKQKSQKVIDEFAGKIYNYSKVYKLQEDRKETVKTILYIQRMHKKKTKFVSQGMIVNNSHFMRDEFTAEENADVAKVLANMNECNFAAQWFAEAVFQQDLVKCGGTKLSRNAEELLASAREREKLIKNPKKLIKEYEEQLLKQAENPEATLDRQLTKIHEDIIKYMPKCNKTRLKKDPIELKYHKLCRGKGLKKNSTTNPRFNCFYADSSEYLKLFRYGVEIVHLDPMIVMYHDMVSSQEITELKRKAKYLFMMPIKKATEPKKSQVAKISWLKLKKKSAAAKISSRIERLTQLSGETAENLQVVNYGIGGRFGYHVDYLKDSSVDSKGNRIATFMIYMSDVEVGGETVFLDLKLSIKPKQGAGLFWYNLKKSLQPDKRMTHAACPVLIGNKWIANKWFRSSGQIFKRPCGLKKKL